VLITCADVGDLIQEVGFSPSTTIREGLQRFTDWYQGYYPT